MARKNKQPLQIVISPQAKQDLTNILQYLEQNWSQKSIENFLQKLEAFYSIISINPNLFGYYNRKKAFVNMHLQSKILFITAVGKMQLK